MNPTIEDINKAILAAMTKRPQPILGAQLGALIRDELPAGVTLDMKSQFGGLRRMLDQCARGQVFWVGKSSLDDLYSTTSSSVSVPAQHSEPSAWVVFHNPDIEGHVYFDRSTQQMKSTRDASLPEGCDSVMRVSHSDQRQMIQDFIQQHVNEEDKGLFDTVSNAEEGNYWSLFKVALAGSKLLPAWQKHRFEALRVLGTQRLEKAGVPAEVQQQVIDQAIKDSSQMRSARSAKKSEVALPQPKRQEHSQTHGIHALAAQVVAQMSEDDLAAVNVPLGAVWKALKMRY